MESWQDRKGYLIGVGVVFIGLCGVFYYSSVWYGEVHPIRNTFLFAGAVIVLCGASALLLAAIFIPIFTLIMKASKKEDDEIPCGPDR